MNRKISSTSPATLIPMLCLWLLLSACTGKVDTESTSLTTDRTPPDQTLPDQTPPDQTLSGTVGSPSLSNATVTLRVSDGSAAASTISTADTSYTLAVPESLALPNPIEALHIQVEGGINLLTGQPSSVRLRALTFEPGILNPSHLSTLAAEITECRGPASQAKLDAAWTQVAGFIGLAPALAPLVTTATAAELVQLLRADLNLAESTARTVHALANAGIVTDAATVVAALACDLDDDGRLNGSITPASNRLLSVFKAARAGVVLELGAGTPYLEGSAASTQINETLRQLSGDSDLDINATPLPQVLLDSAAANLALLLADFPDAELLELLDVLADPNALSRLPAEMTSARLTMLWSLPERLALADQTVIDNLSLRLAGQAAAQPPIVSLSASSSAVAVDEAVLLSWASANADQCRAVGAWTGSRPLDGTFTTSPLSQSASFELLCAGLGGLSQASVQIAVSDPTTPPQISFSADASSVDQGGATMLRWSSVNATACAASDGWSGSQPIIGSQSTGALQSNASFSLACSGPGGSASASVTVGVIPTPVPEPVPEPDPDPDPIPTLTFSSSATSLDSGQAATLSWTTTEANSCQASGGWSGSQPLNDSASTGALTSSSTFALSCEGPGGSVSRDLTITVNVTPAPAITFNAAESLIDSGTGTSLSWSASNASSCTASGGWSGSRASSGTEPVGPLTAQTTFSLNCSGPGGSAIAMVSVSVNGSLSLNWVAPSENVDGSPLIDLARYRVYYGTASRNYSGMSDIADPTSTTTTIALPSGDYYVAMTALDADDNESAYSNEVLKTVP